jgi:acyl carrier protein
VTVRLADLIDIVRDVMRDPDLDLSLATRFEDLPNWDSMHLIGVVVEAECRLGLRFEPEEIEALLTAADLLRAIRAKQALTVP